jgi:hypothetical protein
LRSAGARAAAARREAAAAWCHRCIGGEYNSLQPAAALLYWAIAARHRSSDIPAAAACALLALAAAAAFWPALHNGFVWDDKDLIVENAGIAGLDPARLRWMFTTLYYTTYQPLGWLSYAVIRAAAGLDPAAFHLASLVCHAAVACAFFEALRRLLDKAGARPAGWTALAGALLFCAHPLQAATVAWATELPDQLATLFFLLAVCAHVDGRGRARGAGTAALFAASLLCRWKGIVLPAVLLALDFWPLRRLRSRAGDRLGLRDGAAAWAELLPLFGMACAALLVNARAKTGGEYAPALHPAFAARGLWLFPLKLLWPSNLIALYSLHEPDTLALPGGLLLALTALVAAWLWLARRRAPAALLAAASYAAAVAPPLLNSQRGTLFAFQHYAYLSCLPLFALAAEGLRRLGLRRPGAAAALCAAAVAAGLAGSRARCADWRDSVALWTRALSVDPGCRVAYGNLGQALLVEGRGNDAYFPLAAALNYNPDDPTAREDLEYLRRAYPALKPDQEAFWVHMAADELSLGRAADAERLCLRALTRRPRMPEAHEGLAAALAAQGREAEAARHLAAARRWREAERGGA